MIDHERFSVFARSMERDLTPELEALRADAERDTIPIIRREMQGLLRFLLHLKKPARILEIGSGVGFSSLFMLSCMEELGAAPVTSASGASGPLDAPARIDTIEKSPVNAAQTRANLAAFGAGKAITLIEGDAGLEIKKLTGPYEFIFLDGPKAQYLLYLPILTDLLSPGGILLADNVLKEGEIMDSRYATPRRQRTIHARMHDYLYAVTHDPRLTSTVLPLGDGVCVSLKKEQSHA